MLVVAEVRMVARAPEFAYRLAELGRTGESVASEAGIHATTLSKIRGGAVCSKALARSVALAMKVPVERIFTDDETAAAPAGEAA